MKQVDPQSYSADYFLKAYDSPDYSKKIDNHHFPKKFYLISGLISILPGDTIVDFGCGNGDFTFLINQKFGCSVIGIDYSKTAIDICLQKLALYQQNYPDKSKKISFINADNSHLPELQHIKAVFLNDVVEHLYNEEIRLIFNKFKNWNHHNYPKILIHTDNDIFLRFFYWLPTLYSLITGKMTLQQLKVTLNYSRRYHINLTNQYKFKKVMRSVGFNEERVAYPVIDQDSIIRQLYGPVPKFISNFITFSLRRFHFAFPSFFAVYSPSRS